MAKGKKAKSLGKFDIIKAQEENGEVGVGQCKDWRPDKEQQQRYLRIMREWESAITFRTEYDSKWQECVARYKAEPFFYEDGRAGVVLPVGKLIIETAQAQESKSPPSFAYSANENKEDVKKAEIMDYVVKKHVWNRKYVDLDYKLDVLNQDKMILGTMYQYIGYRKLYRTIRNKKVTGEITKKKELFYDDIVVDNLYPQDVWLHPLASCVAESPWCFIRKRFDYATWAETYSDTEMYYNQELVKPGAVYEGYDRGGETLWRDLADNVDQVVVVEKWDKMRDELVVYANGVEIYEGPNPYEDKELPITDYRNRLQYNTYLGESEMERIATLSDALNAFINIAIDKEKRSGTGINLLDNQFSEFDDVGSLFSSTQAIRVDSPKDSFVHYDMPGMSSSTDNMIKMLMDFLVFSTGIDFRQITDLASSTKATVAALRREISQQRINLNVNRNENCGVKRLGWLLAKRVQQFYTLPLVEGIVDQDLGGKKKGGKQYRELRIPDVEMEEVPGKGGAFNEESLRVKGTREGAVSFIHARPEYLRLKGDIAVKVIPGSTMGAIQELQKTKAQEYIGVATEVLKPPAQQGGAPQPWLSVKYGLEQYVKAMGYDVDKAFDTADKEGETAAQSEAAPLVDAMSSMYGVPGPESQNQGAVMQGGRPPGPAEPKQPALTGQRSEPMQALANELGPQNRVTNKPQ